MSDVHPEQASDGFSAVENGSSEGDNFEIQLGSTLNSEGLSVISAPAVEDQESNHSVYSDPSADKSNASNGADDSVFVSEVFVDRSFANQEPGTQKNDCAVGESNDVKATEDASKDDMFVDAPDELTVYDGKSVHSRDTLDAAGSQDGFDQNSGDTKRPVSDNEMQVRQLMDEVGSLRAMLGNTIDERDGMAQYCEELRETFMEEVARLHHQLKCLSDHQLFPFTSDDALMDKLQKAETGAGEVKTENSIAPWQNLVNECENMIERAAAERSQSEATKRELNAVLFMKQEEIENLNARIAELSHSLKGSSNSTLEDSRTVELVMDKISASLATALNHDELSNDSITDKVHQLDEMISMLIERHNQFVCDSCELRQKELHLLEKLSCMEVENTRLAEQLAKDKELMEMANAELGKTKMELEQEKNRCANVREKLTLAVTKGKTLVQQRDSLRQTLADKTGELEKCTIDLQEKSSALEAAELSKGELIKSANLVYSLQESLMLRDTVVEKFEDIISQISVPMELQSADLVAKLGWLLEDRNALAGVALDFHKIKSALFSFDFPQKFSPSDLESLVIWLGEAFYRTRDELSRVKDEVDQVSEAAYNQIDSLSAALFVETQASVYLQEEFEELMRECSEVVEKEHKVSLDRDQIVTTLTDALRSTMQNLGMAYQPLSDIEMLINGCFGKIKELGIASSVNAETFERVQSLLYVRDQELSMCEKMLEEEMLERPKVNCLSNELEVTRQELLALKVEKSLLLKDFERSEEKSATLREKLSMAVKKGKGLAQDRENLKGVLSEKNDEVEKLKTDLQQLESAQNDCRSHMDKLFNDVECIPRLEADLVDVKQQRDQLERNLAERNNMSQRMIESINCIVLPVDMAFEEPIEKMNWLSGYFSECHLGKTHAEEELRRVERESANLNSKLTEAKTTIKLLNDALSVSEGNVSQLAEEKMALEVSKAYIEQQLQKVIVDANSHAEQESRRIKEEIVTLDCMLGEANKTIDSLEIALSISENKVSQLEAKNAEVEVGKAGIEQLLQKALEEAHSMNGKLSELSVTTKSLEDALSLAENNISVLASEKEDALAGKAVSEIKFEKSTEEIALLTSNLTEANENIKLLEEELSRERTDLALHIKERNEAEVGRTFLEGELMELKEKVVSQAGKLMETEQSVTFLKDALSKAESNISVLVDEKNAAEQKILTISSKLGACMENLDGTDDSSEIRFQELFDHLKSLQKLLEDDGLLSSLTTSFEEKIKSLKDMNCLLKHTRYLLFDRGSELPHNLDVTEVDSSWAKLLSNYTKNMLNGRMDGLDSEDLSSNFSKVVSGLHLRNETLADRFESFSTFTDDLIASLLRELLEIRDQAIVTHDLMGSLKQNVTNMEINVQDQEKTIFMLRNDIDVLLSACSYATQELQCEFEKNLPVLDFIPERVKANCSKLAEENDGGVKMADKLEWLKGNQYAELAEKLLSTVKNSLSLSGQFGNICKSSTGVIEELQKKLQEAQKASEKALGESKYSQHKISLLESDVESLHASCTDMKHKLGDYQIKEDKLMEREAELLSSYDDLLKQKEAKDQFPAASQLEMIFEKIHAIKIHAAETETGDMELKNFAPVKKLFYIIDSVPELYHQITLLSYDKEVLQSILSKQVDEIKQMEEVVEANSKVEQKLEKFRDELIGIELGLDNLILKLGGSNSAGESKSAHELLAVLENLIMSRILESENSKSNVNELTAKLSGSQKLVDELSIKIRVLEDSIQGRQASPETVLERRIYEAPTIPSGSEISEIEDVGSIGKKAIPPAPSAAHVRTMRKGSSDHLALNIDLESMTGDTDEDKGHEFKSLNTTGLIPKQGKHFADRIDGIWVSGSRVLTSRPRARLGVVAYWLLLHMWLVGTLL